MTKLDLFLNFIISADQLSMANSSMQNELSLSCNCVEVLHLIVSLLRLSKYTLITPTI